MRVQTYKSRPPGISKSAHMWKSLMETVARQSILSHDLTVLPGSFSNKGPTHARTQRFTAHHQVLRRWLCYSSAFISNARKQPSTDPSTKLQQPRYEYHLLTL